MSELSKCFSGVKNIRAGSWLLLAAALLVLLLLTGRKTESAGVADGTEARMERVLNAVDGAGNVKVMIMEEAGSVIGVLVVAEGADDVSVRLRLQSAVHTLMSIDNADISVVPMRKETQ